MNGAWRGRKPLKSIHIRISCAIIPGFHSAPGQSGPANLLEPHGFSDS